MLLVSLCLMLSHFSDLSVVLFYFSTMLFVAKMTGKRRIGDFFDYTFGDETWVRARPGAMSMGTARFLRGVRASLDGDGSPFAVGSCSLQAHVYAPVRSNSSRGDAVRRAMEDDTHFAYGGFPCGADVLAGLERG